MLLLSFNTCMNQTLHRRYACLTFETNKRISPKTVYNAGIQLKLNKTNNFDNFSMNIEHNLNLHYLIYATFYTIHESCACSNKLKHI